MKIKEKYRIISSAVKEFNNDFKCYVEFKEYSDGYILSLMKKYHYWSMVEVSYCCFGLKQCCWQELYAEGNWDLTLDTVKKSIIELL